MPVMKYNRVGLYIRTRKEDPTQSIQQLCRFLDKMAVSYCFEQASYEQLPATIKHTSHTLFDVDDDSLIIDLIIVVGGDGSFLHACKLFHHRHIPLTGINHGRLGFLTDISFEQLEPMLSAILQGQGRTEPRYFFDGYVGNSHFTALNDFVIQTHNAAGIVDIEVMIGGSFAFDLRCDGIIITSSTGSTAYGLSAGGPLLHPDVAALALVPLAAHTLSARPCVIADNKPLEICNKSTDQTAVLSVDGEPKVTLAHRQSVIISKSDRNITLIHHPDYDYFGACRSKLGWHT